ncbi:hypothetical protein HanRHA438_Chr02g0061701 [Helianthus annuus]|nr:hypothetical protein HanRHA438_Chr02g0061701 [Helianthus annuus]
MYKSESFMALIQRETWCMTPRKTKISYLIYGDRESFRIFIYGEVSLSDLIRGKHWPGSRIFFTGFDFRYQW